VLLEGVNHKDSEKLVPFVYFAHVKRICLTIF